MSDATRDQNKFIVRMPPGMRDRVAEEAKKNNRSMNAEIVARLEYSFNARETEAQFAATWAEHDLKIREIDQKMQVLFERMKKHEIEPDPK